MLTRQVKPSQHVRMEKGLQIVLGQRCNEEFQIISFRPLCFDSSRPTCIYMSFECYFTHVVLFLTQPFGAKRYMTAHLLCSFILSAARILRVRERSAVRRATEDSGFNNLSIYRVWPFVWTLSRAHVYMRVRRMHISARTRAIIHDDL